MGFHLGDSTVNQLPSITHSIFLAFDCNPTLDVRSVFLDKSKAFDPVWHEGLICKLSRNGVSGKLLMLLTSFLSNRKQRSILNGRTSKWGSIKAGVPQGSVLGPLLFLVYINVTNGLRCSSKLFADDITLFTTVYDTHKAAADLNHDVILVNIWARKWRMSFNPDITKQAVEVTFSRKRYSSHHPSIFFNDTLVKKVQEQNTLASSLTLHSPSLPVSSLLSLKLGKE